MISLYSHIKKAIKLTTVVATLLFVSCTAQLPQVANISDTSTITSYKERSNNLNVALSFIEKHGIDGLKKMSGKVEIAGNKVFANISDIELKPITDELIFEAHDKYIDIHLILEGEEFMGLKDRKDCKNVTIEELSQKDYILFKEKPTSVLKMSVGQYIVVFPNDAHAPSLGNGKVRKCVIKIAVE
ncbi:MAG: DUF386 domain-containing protein [Verrucomicrobiaceae bacterium]|nr:DUF386 domain-containing protein [Verrucomicrobiaceae bacterium]